MSDTSFENNNLLHDLSIAVGLWVKDGSTFSFAHRSLQEYFAALFVTSRRARKGKEEIYSRLENTLDSNSSILWTSHDHFLMLCSEIDPYNFTKFVLLPNL